MPTITLVDKPLPPSSSTNQSSSAQDAKSRAIAALLGNAPQGEQKPQVADNNNVSVEELGAVQQSQEPQEQEAPRQDDKSEATEQAQEETPLSTQYAILARKEKALRAKAVAQEQQFKQREEALKAREAELQSRSSFDQSKYISIDELKRDALSALSKVGIDYDQISQQALISQSPEAQAFKRMREELEQEIQKVREEQANTRKSYEESQAQAYQQALKQIKTDAEALVNADPSFETIKETGSVNDIVELIERTFNEDGVLMTVEEAARAVEEHLVEEAMKIYRIKKIQERIKPVAKPTAAQSQATGAPQQSKPAQPQQQMKTLTNSVGNTRPLTAKERALLAFKGELK